MALDLEKIRQKVAELNGELKKNRFSDWRWAPPESGECLIRALPWKDSDGQPIKERNFYYNIGIKGGALSPTQFQKPDPVREFIKKLYKDDTDASKELAKKLYPSMRGYIPVIVRGEEDKGVRIWPFSPKIYKRLYAMLIDADIGDFTDPLEGRDLKVNVVKNHLT